jgi:hypothetical protein
LRGEDAVEPGDLPGIIVVGAVSALAGIISAGADRDRDSADRARPSASLG